MERRRRGRDRTLRDINEILPEGHRGHEFYVGRPLVPPEPRNVVFEKKEEK